jgi:D-sedoheptulose 7-phosphate isomerase
MAIEKLVDQINRMKQMFDATVYTCGNGGSASTAEHFATDLFRKGIKAICLNSNTSIMTMLANDYGYKWVFSKQMDRYSNPQDLLVMFSVSGNSSNLIQCLGSRYDTAAIIGRGGELSNANYVLTVDSDDYGIVESKHLAIAHCVCEAIDE